MQFSLSIIIPTHKRTDILRQCLECIAKQTLLQRDAIEVIVVSDGPDEKTAEMIQSLSWPFALQHFAIPKSQQGVARNHAVKKARGRYSLLIGDDIFLAPDACEKHLSAHEQISNTPCAVLGLTTWDPLLRITPLMRWMEESGVQFGYPKIEKFSHEFLPEEDQHWFTYTSNISLLTKFLWKYPFQEDITHYGWEDIEWGFRLAEEGIRLFYEPDAKAYHHHAFTDEEVWERSRRLGISAREMERLLPPSLSFLPRGWKRVAYEVLALLPTYHGKHCKAFLRGIKTPVQER